MRLLKGICMGYRYIVVDVDIDSDVRLLERGYGGFQKFEAPCL